MDETEVIRELEKPCPNCGGEKIKRVVGHNVGVIPEKIEDFKDALELTEGVKQREYDRLFSVYKLDRLIVCSRCTWAK